ncbi:hypothetical protein Bca52824_071032 [Brassica carinata]|uniref:Hyaluronan/mRNA-binding protein domain-containing protein n=1 Tax=Brassica carinata TaxID=52824 RepID=A0A8X7Q6L2_BRACI|nr:hypothetical protein Bca52824_071032 [Brassica carinata]
MATVNPFDLLDDDTEDLHKLVAAKPLKVEKPAPVQPGKLPTKPLPPSQAVREGKNGPGGARGGGVRGRSGGFNREPRNNDGPANENGYVGGGYRRSEEGDGARRGGSVGGYRGRGGRRGGFNSGESGDFERPRRNFDRQSGTGHGNGFKRDGAGRGNWGTTEDEIPPVTEESAAVVEKSLAVEKEGGEANKETPVEEKEPEDKSMKVLEEKRKALQATKIEERKVDTKAFETMQQLSNKSNNDEVFIKLGTEKDKRPVEKEEKTKKEGRGGRGPREGADGRGRGRGPRGPDGGENQRAVSPAVTAAE